MIWCVPLSMGALYRPREKAANGNGLATEDTEGTEKLILCALGGYEKKFHLKVAFSMFDAFIEPGVPPPVFWTFVGLAIVTAGFVSTITHAAGPIVSLYMFTQGMGKTLFVGTVAWTFTLINIAKFPFYIAVGLVRTDVLLFGLTLRLVNPHRFVAGPLDAPPHLREFLQPRCHGSGFPRWNPVHS